MVVLGQAATPLQIPESFRPYGNLVEALYSTDGLTFEDAVRMVEPLSSALDSLQEDSQTPNLLFLLTQKAVFDAEETRLKTLCDTDPENNCLEQAWFLIWDTAERYQSDFFQRGDFTILNSGPRISRFFAMFPASFTGLFPLHIHKLLFLMYISQFLGSISNIVSNEAGFFKDEDAQKPFLTVFDVYLKKSTTECGIKLFEHALWILREHVVYVGAKQGLKIDKASAR